MEKRKSGMLITVVCNYCKTKTEVIITKSSPICAACGRADGLYQISEGTHGNKV